MLVRLCVEDLGGGDARMKSAGDVVVLLMLLLMAVLMRCSSRDIALGVGVALL